MISCSDYDYIEIVCLFNYPIQLTLKNGGSIIGTALDTTRNDAREECIKINITGKDTLVVLDSIAKLRITVDNPHFVEVVF
ncbi:Rho-binding antiterminator [Catenovulum agarivorans]|uniref:Rho-binding antiterminator n=1 Tax=Catenovulum agarivorans TaxID=1172192 RepID=UPI0002ED491F|nr:Rho-binding antiterminator [Catenovulum agarivorans]